jgi:hypothetical protein
MLLRTRVPSIDGAPVAPSKGYEHLPASSIAVLRWLNAAGVDFVLVGPLARAVRGDSGAQGPLAIVPAPYGRNLDRLAGALNAVHARRRSTAAMLGIAAPLSGRTDPHRFTAEGLVRAEHWSLRCGEHDLDIEGRHAGAPSFQELLYESVRIELADGVSAEVAAPEDIEHYAHVRRTGVAPQLQVSRVSRAG